MTIDRDDDALLRALQEGDERDFSELVERWSSIMLRLALSHVESRALAEEVVQDAWMTVLRSLDRFERRSAFRTWVLGIVVNLARSRARDERRSVPLSAESGSPVFDPTRFLPRTILAGLTTGRWSLSSGAHPRRTCSRERPAK